MIELTITTLYRMNGEQLASWPFPTKAEAEAACQSFGQHIHHTKFVAQFQTIRVGADTEQKPAQEAPQVQEGGEYAQN